MARPSTNMTIGMATESTNLLTAGCARAFFFRNSWAKEMWRASSATWIAITPRMIGWMSSPERRMSFWMWSIGSSPASTAMKKKFGNSAPAGAARWRS